MSKIKSKNTKSELLLKRLFRKNKISYKHNCKLLPGKPDFILDKFKTAIFVNGCFWHFHKKCKEAHIPKTNTKFWMNKLIANVKRDKKRIKELKQLGWNVTVIWECEIEKNLENVKKRISKIINQ